MKKIFTLVILLLVLSCVGVFKEKYNTTHQVDSTELNFETVIVENSNKSLTASIQVIPLDRNHITEHERVAAGKVTEQMFLTVVQKVAIQYCKKPAKELKINYKYSGCANADILAIPCFIGEAFDNSSKSVPIAAYYKFTCDY